MALEEGKSENTKLKKRLNDDQLVIKDIYYIELCVFIHLYMLDQLLTSNVCSQSRICYASQQRAVNTGINQPLAIIAGAGTGKTEVSFFLLCVLDIILNNRFPTVTHKTQTHFFTL